MAQAKNLSGGSPVGNCNECGGLVDAAAMFAGVPAKSNLGTRSRQLREVDRHAPLLVAWGGPVIPVVETARCDHHIAIMCGRVIQSSAPMRLAILEGMDARDSRVHNYPPRWNGAPSQDLLVIRRNHDTGEISLDPLRWGLIPYWCKDPKGGRKPINAKCETVDRLPTFRDAYQRRRCIVPVDGFFEWKAIKGQKAKQPYAIAMKDGSPFGLVGFGRTGKSRLRASGPHLCDHHDGRQRIGGGNPRPHAADPRAERLCRWLSDEPDPRDLMRPFPAEPMRMWPISTRVNKPENDDPSIVEPIELAHFAA